MHHPSVWLMPPDAADRRGGLSFFDASIIPEAGRLCRGADMSKNEKIQWQNRIVGHGVKPADQFTHHPGNPKIHPKSQREALRGALSEVGWIAPVIENVRTGLLVDGHERVWAALERNEDVPYIQVDLSEDEENYVLATLDPIGMMARHDAAQLDALLQAVNSSEAGVQAMLDALAQDAGIKVPDFQPVGVEEQPRLDQKKPIICPNCGHEFTP